MARRLWGVLLFATVVSGLTAAALLLYERRWTSTFTLTPTGDAGGVGGSLGSLSSLASQFGASLGGAATEDLANLAAIANSRALLIQLLAAPVSKPDGESGTVTLLQLVDDAEEPDSLQRIEGALRALRDRWIAVEIDPKSPLLRVRATAPTARAAYEVSSAYLSLLSDAAVSTQRPLKVQSASFLRGQASQVMDSLSLAEAGLARFRAENRSIGSSPALQLAEERQARRIQAYLDLYQAIRRQLASAELAAAQNVPNFAVIDPPFMPGRADDGNLFLKVVAAWILSAFFLMGLIVLHELIEYSRRAYPELWELAWSGVPTGVRSLVRRGPVRGDDDPDRVTANQAVLPHTPQTKPASRQSGAR